MKKIVKSILVASAMSLFLGMTSHAAVKQVQITSPILKGTYKVGYGSGVSKKLQLKTQVTVTGNSKKTVTYKSSNTAVLKVNNKGKVTIKKPGKATITVTSKANKKKKDKIKINVVKIEKKITRITPKVKTATINIGEKVSVKGKIKPTKVSLADLTYKSSDPSIATVTQNGSVKGKKAGTVTIKISSRDGGKAKANAIVTVLPKKVTAIQANQSTITIYKDGIGGSATQKIGYKVSPSNATNKGVTYKSSNTAVATVSSTGVVTAKGGGEAAITITSADGSNKKTTVKIQVYETETLKIAADKAVSPLNLTTNGSISFSDPQAVQACIDTIVKTAVSNYGFSGFDMYVTVDSSTQYKIVFTAAGMEITRTSDGSPVNIFNIMNGKTYTTLKLEGALTTNKANALIMAYQSIQDGLSNTVSLGNITMQTSGTTIDLKNVNLSGKGLTYTEAGTVYSAKVVSGNKIAVTAMAKVANSKAYQYFINMSNGLITN